MALGDQRSDATDGQAPALTDVHSARPSGVRLKQARSNAACAKARGRSARELRRRGAGRGRGEGGGRPRRRAARRAMRRRAGRPRAAARAMRTTSCSGSGCCRGGCAAPQALSSGRTAWASSRQAQRRHTDQCSKAVHRQSRPDRFSHCTGGADGRLPDEAAWVRQVLPRARDRSAAAQDM